MALCLSTRKTLVAETLVAAMAEATTTERRQPYRQFLVPMEVITSENL